MRGGDWFHLVLLALAFLGAAYGLVRRLTHADEADVKRRIAADGVSVVWAKRLDTLKGAGLLNSRVTFYDVLVERDGVRRIEVWRDGLEGLSKDH